MKQFNLLKDNRILLTVAILGVVSFLIVSSVGPFRDQLFSRLFPKPASQAAAEDAFTVTNAAGSPLPQTTPGTFTTDSLDVTIKLKDVNALNP